MTARDEALGGRGFGWAAAEYVAGRPGYPAASVAWLVGAARDVVDVGAGTGKLTGALVAPGRTVVAVEPDDGMRAALEQEVPGVQALAGAGEALPLPDASADAVVYGQAWHWVDVERASADAARVLRPGGALGLIWNTRDTGVDWVAELGSIIRASPAERMVDEDAVRVAAPFGALEHRTERWTAPMTPDQVVAMAASRSFVIALDPEERDDVLAEVRALIGTHPATADRAVVELPYTTTALRAVRP